MKEAANKTRLEKASFHLTLPKEMIVKCSKLGSWFHLRFEHFRRHFMVCKNIDHRKLSSIC